MSIEIFLLSMQAAGVIGDMIGTKSQIDVGRRARDIEQSQIETRLAEERLAASMSAVDAMKSLRMTLASQRAQAAARGADIGAGSAFTMGAVSRVDHAADERVRRMNLLSREATLRSGGNLAALHTLTSETKLGQALTNRLFNQIPFSELKQEFDRLKPPTTTTTPQTSPKGINR